MSTANLCPLKEIMIHEPATFDYLLLNSLVTADE